MTEIKGPAAHDGGSLESYEQWHGSLPVDAAVDTPWHSLVRKHLDPASDVAGRRVLEIGCGRGGFACWLASQTPGPREFVAADFSSTAVEKGQEHARELGIDCISWETNDIQAISHPDASFDTVISCETIEHVPNPALAIRELARVLKPSGRLLLTSPNYLSSMGLYRLYLKVRGREFTEVGQPINQFLLLPRTRRWVEDAGIEVKTVETSGFYLPLPGGLRDAEWTSRPSFLMKGLGLHSIIAGVRA